MRTSRSSWSICCLLGLVDAVDKVVVDDADESERGRTQRDCEHQRRREREAPTHRAGPDVEAAAPARVAGSRVVHCSGTNRYPAPRTVWMVSTPNGWSIFLRR